MIDKSKLFLIPTPLDREGMATISPEVVEIVKQLSHFIVEEIRSSYWFFKRCGHLRPEENLQLQAWNEHQQSNPIDLLEPLRQGNDIGLISEAGMPCIADPGHQLVAQAHIEGFTVVPLAGPSSMMMALMASGFSGQHFTFHGYLPVDSKLRGQKLKQMEVSLRQTGYTQLWIETPYRNKSMMEDLLRHLQPDTELCVAVGLSSAKGWVQSRTIARWNGQFPSMHKIPAVFLIGQSQGK